MTQTIPPHGGELIDLVLKGDEASKAADEAQNLPKIELGPREIADLEMLAVGAMSPLRGFMTEKDYRSTLEDMRLSNGSVWSLPITLSVDDDGYKRISGSDSVALTIGDRPHAILDVEQTFQRDRQAEAQGAFGTTDSAHPGVAALEKAGDMVLGGALRVIEVPQHETFNDHRMTPAETRAAFEERGWRTVVGFQTRNPVHRAHEYIQKCALEIVDGLLLHPLVGETKSDDIPADVRMRSYESLLRDYYPADRTLLGVYPAAMRYGGPREAIFHAIARKNYGCTHFIVGRDHAGVGSYYGTYDAQRIFDEFAPDELGITPLFFEHTFYCTRCGAMASYKTCPHGAADHLILSGTMVREMLSRGEMPPPEFSRPEVVQILIEAYSQERAGEEHTAALAPAMTAA